MSSADVLNGLKTICIIDDDEAVRSSLAAVASVCGAEVVCFNSAERYLESVWKHRARLLVVDVRLPGLGGLELLDTLRKQSLTPPCVVLTGHVSVQSLDVPEWPSDISVLSKPCRPENLVASITKALS